MSDLISRSELLHYMKNTELSQYIDEVNKGNDNYNSTPLYDYVKEMPTAYDPGKVVEELDMSRTTTGGLKLELIPCDKAIEIVKQGGVGKVVE